MDCPIDGNTVVQPHDSSLVAATPETASTAEIAEFALDGDHWRREIAARLQRYRSRRKPREPRYPSLLLPFDSGDRWSQTSSARALVPTPEELSPPARTIEEVTSGDESRWEASSET